MSEQPNPEVPDATPAAEAHAEETGVDLATVEGTGVDGKITKPDVAAAAEESSTPATLPAIDQAGAALNAPQSAAFDPATQGHGFNPDAGPLSPDLIPGTPAGDSEVYGGPPDPKAALPDYSATPAPPAGE